MVELLPHAAAGGSGGAALAPVAIGSRPAADSATVTITLTVEQFRRVRNAFAKSDAVLRRLDHVRSHPLSGAAREARSEIGAAVAHLDRALPPTPHRPAECGGKGAVEVVTGITAEGREPSCGTHAFSVTANGEAAPAGARHDTGLPSVGKQGAREVTND